MIAILAATAGEILATQEALEGPVDVSFAGRKILRGCLGGREVVAGHTGVGKVLAAMTVQGVVDRYRPSALIFSGIAGALNRSYEIGDVIVARECLQHDFDATQFGFPRGCIPYEDPAGPVCTPSLVDYALRWEKQGRALQAGRILSGDRVISSRGESADPFFIDELSGDAVDMESAAAALVARLNGIPFLVMRIISDKADGLIPGGFRSFVKESSQLIRDFAGYMAGCPATDGTGA